MTKNGDDDLVVAPVEESERLKRRDHRVVGAGELTEAEIAVIARAEVAAEQAHLHQELEDGLHA